MSSMMRVVLCGGLALLPGVAMATVPATVAQDDVIAKQCRKINIGTEARPRWVQDPGCSTGR